MANYNDTLLVVTASRNVKYLQHERQKNNVKHKANHNLSKLLFNFMQYKQNPK